MRMMQSEWKWLGVSNHHEKVKRDPDDADISIFASYLGLEANNGEQLEGTSFDIQS